ncbi:hypothetical protein EZV62_024758 [Acer yangbiense]|uniref:Uncharacterized protein n=1 Tax=Acer yangbiense TaxID=1000413 RepID=A0A5C7GVY3_9ROSI|nr:hypothetical protein EZV62_024758 [Acer yangbiense]
MDNMNVSQRKDKMVLAFTWKPLLVVLRPQGVVPDDSSCSFVPLASCRTNFIKSILQGIGNGLPLEAVVTTPEVANVMAEKILFDTFG